MKSGLLFIFLLAFTRFGFTQNVKIIRASERSTVSNTVIIPAPPHTNPVNNKPSASPNAPSPKNSNVKSVHGTTCKKPCVKKVCCDTPSSSDTPKKATTESTKK